MMNDRAGRAIRRVFLSALFLFAISIGPALAEPIKIAVLKFGTVNWELDVIQRLGLDKAEGIEIEVLALANKNATSVALQANEVDVIVSDWLWVSRQRAEGEGYTFVPYSTALGGVMVPPDSPIQTLEDLNGKRIGIAGGPLDKSWLLLRALAGKRTGADLDKEVEKVFAAPPLLNEEMMAGRLDAAINFWPYSARLEAIGFRRFLGVGEVVQALGIESKVPLIGYVFDEAWAEERRDDLLAFFRSVSKAKSILAESDAEWESLRPLMRVKDEATFRTLRDRFREGIPVRWGDKERADAARLFAVLAEVGGKKLVGRDSVLREGTFWPLVSY